MRGCSELVQYQLGECASAARSLASEHTTFTQLEFEQRKLHKQHAVLDALEEQGTCVEQLFDTQDHW